MADMAAPRRVWLQAARPATLPAAVAPVLVGTAVAEGLIVWRALAAMVVALGLQVAVNFANDYEDGRRGVDTAARTGPVRAVAAGLVAPSTMRNATVVALAVAAAAGVTLAAAVDWWLLVVGAACGLAALGYSGGPRPYASAGLGEVFVFLTFGLVATTGSAYVQDGVIPPAAWPAAVAMGLLAAAILVANNLRDVPTDAAAGKRTLAVRLGDRPSRRLYTALIAGSLACVPLTAWLGDAWPASIALVAGGQAVRPVRAVLVGGSDRAGARGSELVAVLVDTARLQLLVAVLLASGLVVAA